MQIKDLAPDRRVLSYGGLALLTILVLGILSSLWLSSHFSRYVLKQQQTQRAEVAFLLNQQYIPDQGWDSRALGAIGISSLNRGMFIKVISAEGNTLWDAHLYNNWLCEQMIAHYAELTGNEGVYAVTPYPLITNSVLVGTAEIGYYGPYYFGQNEADFLRGMQVRLILTSIAILLLILVVLRYIFPGEKKAQL